jgi:subtilisin family serine protease
MPPSDVLEFSRGEFFGKRILFRRQHLNVQFTNERADSDAAQNLLRSSIGPSVKAAGTPIGNWGCFSLPLGDTELLNQIENLNGERGIDFAEPDIMFIATVTPIDPPFAENAVDRQWALEKIDMFRAWDIQKGSDEVIVGILDSGLTLDSANDPGQVINAPLGTHLPHEDQDGIRFLAGKNFITNKPWPFDDYWYHGSFLAGVVAATPNNETGIAGMNWKSPIYVPKVLYAATEMNAAPANQPSLRSTSALVHMGIRDLLDFSAEPTAEFPDRAARHAVVNLCIQIDNDDSLDDYPDGTLKAIFSLVAKNDAIICISAGNAGDGVQPPGLTGLEGEHAANVLVVGAININDERHGTTCFGHPEMVFAPGHDIRTTHKPVDDYSHQWGTSMATPHVSALASLMWSEAPDKSPAEIVSLLKETCRLPDAAAQNSFRNPAGEKLMGRGIIDAYEALRILKPRICLVLDRSYSMIQSSAAGEPSRIDLMKQMAGEIVEAVDVGSSLGIVSFQQTSAEVASMTVIEVPDDDPEEFLGQEVVADKRAEMRTKIDALTPDGWTSIGSGIERAWEMLKPEKAPRAIIVLTDGMENKPPFLEELLANPLAPLADIPVYAVGWGSPENLEPSGLMSLTTATEGLLVMADQYDHFGSIEVTKFLAQIIGEISGYQPILDPTKTLGPQVRKRKFEFLVGRADTVGEVLIFKPAQIPLEVQVFSPDEVLRENHPPTISGSGRVMRCRFSPGSFAREPEVTNDQPWKVRVSLPSDFRVRYEVPFTLLVRSRSRLKMTCRVRQESHLPGSDMTMLVKLTDRGAPLNSGVTLEVEVTDPDGNLHQVGQDRSLIGERTFTFPGDHPGIYRWRVFCTGKDRAKEPFQRECVLTGAIWTPTPDSEREAKALRADSFKKSG